ncbi:MAG: sigma 54-interacting transcriptional regulator, partial [Bdellovibrionia bacterium]
MIWNLKVNEPSGEIRNIRLQGSMTIGRGVQSNLILRDPTVAGEAAQLWQDNTQDNSLDHSMKSSVFWLKIPTHSPPGQLGGMAVREVQFPIGIPLQLGETHLTIEPQISGRELPSAPVNSQPWLTCAESGKELLWMARKTALTPLSIYLAGETGTGKEVLSHLIHTWSDRKSGPFVPLNCGALPPSLVESELFGHVKGAFTGAIHHRP